MASPTDTARLYEEATTADGPFSSSLLFTIVGEREVMRRLNSSSQSQLCIDDGLTSSGSQRCYFQGVPWKNGPCALRLDSKTPSPRPQDTDKNEASAPESSSGALLLRKEATNSPLPEEMCPGQPSPGVTSKLIGSSIQTTESNDERAMLNFVPLHEHRR
ncbi:hypothetical protein CPLU01_02692 [Colletotrichum plurivorum]|uniref:Uncharacterized protein n=1 Tax=Colletotrichum plurivorum TaxID=2175906 RepID=A0A8H6NLR6_9PEZI|nr:hypothetical protein CPLU01_02692 [Colletotrichum plurivorum]